MSLLLPRIKSPRDKFESEPELISGDRFMVACFFGVGTLDGSVFSSSDFCCDNVCLLEERKKKILLWKVTI